MERFIDAAPGVRLWTEDRGATDAPPLLLIMGAQAPGLGWPDELVDMLASRRRVIRYDHRDTGRSTWAFDQRPYPLSQLAEDAIAVLDGLGIERAHIVGMSLGGMLTQLLIADHPDRLLSATLIGTSALSDVPYVQPNGTPIPPEELPGIAPRLLEMWSRPAEDLGPEAELERRVEHGRLLGGDQLPFDADYARPGAEGHRARRALRHQHRARPRRRVRPESHRTTRPGHSAHSRHLRSRRTSLPAAAPHHLAQAIQGARIIESPAWGTHSHVRCTRRSLPRSWTTPNVDVQPGRGAAGAKASDPLVPTPQKKLDTSTPVFRALNRARGR